MGTPDNGTTSRSNDPRTSLVRRMRALRARHARATSTLQDIEDQRTAMYEAARALEPPLTFREIAEAFDVSEAAIMQKMKRAGVR